MGSITGWIKRQGEIATSLAALTASVVGVIVFFGGQVPPWPAVAEVQTLQQMSIQNQCNTYALWLQVYLQMQQTALQSGANSGNAAAWRQLQTALQGITRVTAVLSSPVCKPFVIQ